MMVVSVSLPSYAGKLFVLTLLSIGGVVCIIGYLMTPSVFDQILSNVVNKILVLAPSSELYESWVDPEIPVYQRFYFFDIQNKDEIKKGNKPRVKEVGPYTYSVTVTPVNVTFNGNSTLSFSKRMVFTFVPELSVGLEGDVITTVNLPLATSAANTKYESWFARLAITALGQIHKQEIFTQISIRDLLWGYQDPLLNNLQTLVGKDMISSDEFGLLLGKNATTDKDVYTIYTGESDRTLLNTISQFNGMNTLTWWGDEYANMVNGTDGSFFHPYIETDETLHVFNPFICRSLPYIYQGDTSYNGVPLKDFYVPQYAYANPSEYPPNAGFCLENQCAPTGILNISTCAMGVPLALSHPHFLYATEEIINSIDGLQHDVLQHQSRMAIEPIMGIPYVFDQRVQINIFLEEIDAIKQTKGIPSLYFPMLWIETHGEMPDTVVNQYKTNIAMSYKMIEVVQWCCVATGCLICIAIALIAASTLFRSLHPQSHPNKQVQKKLADLEKAQKKSLISKLTTSSNTGNKRPSVKEEQV